MIQQPKNYGWTFLKSCNCDGKYQEHFKKGTQVLKVFPNINQWRIENAGTLLKHGTLSEMEANLN